MVVDHDDIRGVRRRIICLSYVHKIVRFKLEYSLKCSGKGNVMSYRKTILDNG